MSGKCKYNNCLKTASFGLPNGKLQYCNSHKTIEMVNLKRKYCESHDCTKTPSFDIPNGKGRFCKKHKTEDMILINTKNCEINGCMKQPNFNIKGNPPRFCFEHKTNEMINVKYKKCQMTDCLKQASFSSIDKKLLFCKEHKPTNVIDIKHNSCEYSNCNLRPIFDFPNGKGRFCKNHIIDGMIDINHKKCIYEGCKLRPSFDLPNGNGSFCKNHKSNNMVNILRKKCEYSSCNVTSPIFDIPGGKGRFCNKHKLDNMINIAHKNCKECNTGVLYGLPGHKPSHCAKHRKPGMIRKSNANCKYIDCKQKALYGINYIPTHCETHKQEHENNLMERQCISCKLNMVLDSNKLCEFCNPSMIKSCNMAKQNLLMEYLDTLINIPLPISTDKIINGGNCGKERPDRIYDFGNKIVVIECDEHQHKNIPDECEKIRMINICQSFGGIPVYFIRWNPDDYKLITNKVNIEPMNKRLKLVGDLLYDIYSSKIVLPEELLCVLYLYYDNWCGIQNQKWDIILKLEM